MIRSNRIIFALLILAFSCNKDDVSPINYPSSYTKSGFEFTGGVRVFSTTGEIKSASIVKRLTKLDTPLFNIFAHYLRHERVLDKLDFVDSKNNVVDSEYRERNCSFETAGDLVILTEIDTTRACCYYQEVFSRSWRYKIGRIKALIYSEFIVSSTRGDYLFGFNGSIKHVFMKNGGDVVAPVIMYYRHSPAQVESGYTNNVLQPAFYKNLASGDTIAIIESRVLYERD
jgi:hypothetical protein